MSAIDLSPILAEVVDATTQGYPLEAAPLPLSSIRAHGKWRVLFTVDDAHRMTGAIRTIF